MARSIGETENCTGVCWSEGVRGVELNEFFFEFDSEGLRLGGSYQDSQDTGKASTLHVCSCVRNDREVRSYTSPGEHCQTTERLSHGWK